MIFTGKLTQSDSGIGPIWPPAAALSVAGPGGPSDSLALAGSSDLRARQWLAASWPPRHRSRPGLRLRPSHGRCHAGMAPGSRAGPPG